VKLQFIPHSLLPYKSLRLLIKTLFKKRHSVSCQPIRKTLLSVQTQIKVTCTPLVDNKLILFSKILIRVPSRAS